MLKALAFKYEERYQDIPAYLAALKTSSKPDISQAKTVPLIVADQIQGKATQPVRLAPNSPQAQLNETLPMNQVSDKAHKQNAAARTAGANAGISSGTTPKGKKGLMIGVGILTVVLLVILGAYWGDIGTSSRSSTSSSSTKTVDIAQAKVGDYVKFGNYEQDNNTSNGPEPIVWRVLAIENGSALLISEKGLDCKKYNETKTEVTWETCTFRRWLNKDFLNAAFNADEQAKIALTTVQNPDNEKYKTKGGNSTQDRVFLLSIDEAEQYFTSGSARQTQPSDYAVAQGAYKSDKGNCWWWLRSPGRSSNYAACVDHVGDLLEFGDYVFDVHDAVRPALFLNL